jgi:hypothetical protein
MYGIGSFDVQETLFPHNSAEYNEDVRGVRVRAGIKSFYIYASKKGKVIDKEDDLKNKRESRYIPHEKLPMSAEIAVHGPILSIVTFRKKIIGVLVEHSDIADSFRAIFDAAWEAAEKYNK